MHRRPANNSSSSAAGLADRVARHGKAVAAFIDQAESISPAAATCPRAPGKWCPMQEALHLALTYRAFAAVFAGAPEFPLLVPPEKAAHYQRTVLPRILAGDWFPSGATAPTRTQPDDRGVTMSSALEQLRAAVTEFHTACLAGTAADLGKTWMHPYFGPTSLPDLVDLLTEHARHHARFLPPGGAG
jgi:DinB superfamily